MRREGLGRDSGVGTWARMFHRGSIIRKSMKLMRAWPGCKLHQGDRRRVWSQHTPTKTRAQHYRRGGCGRLRGPIPQAVDWRCGPAPLSTKLTVCDGSKADVRHDAGALSLAYDLEP